MTIRYRPAALVIYPELLEEQYRELLELRERVKIAEAAERRKLCDLRDHPLLQAGDESIAP